MSDPFGGDETRKAYKEALENAFEASRHLTNFLHSAVKGGEAAEPCANLLAAADALKDADAAWLRFARMSEPEQDWEPVSLQ